MFRCDESAGKYRVTGEYLMGNDGTPSKEEHLLDVFVHAPIIDANGRIIENIPYVSTKTGFEGELCVHEVAWLNTLPGRVYSPRRRFTLTPVTEGKGRAV